ncbi:hypothetical protein GCM10017581_097800 [Dactylosporangium matsuzakiense]|uniref:Uncharacterized protein n=1 Tax=Dactylosporangium matsuzakiense TaxID=53360 RepID=A0A9W6NS61_9ACTN|nr:hypothetical protein GCM10017581_097800 [Dactylosporangium matsuzakiense]
MDRSPEYRRRRTWPATRGRSGRRSPAKALILLIEAIFGSVGGIYLITSSISITVVAAALAAAVAALVLITQR